MGSAVSGAAHSREKKRTFEPDAHPGDAALAERVAALVHAQHGRVDGVHRERLVVAIHRSEHPCVEAGVGAHLNVQEMFIAVSHGTMYVTVPFCSSRCAPRTSL